MRYGYRKIRVRLNREGWKVGKKRVYRLYREEGLTLRQRPRRRRQVAAHRRERTKPRAPHEVWSLDFVADQLADGRRFRALTVVDVFPRECLAIEVGQSLKGEDVVEVLNRIRQDRGVPKMLFCDNGAEFTSQIMDLWAYQNGVQSDFSRPGKPTDNAHVESFNGTFRAECLNAHWFTSLNEAKPIIEAWRREYNESRPQRALGERTPNEFAGHTSSTRKLNLRLVQKKGSAQYPGELSFTLVQFSGGRSRQVLGQTTDEAVVEGPDDAYYPRLSPDASGLLFIERPKGWQEAQPLSLMRVPMAGGLPQLVLQASAYAPWGFRFNCPRRPQRPSVLAERQANQIAFRAFDPVKGFELDAQDLGRAAFVPGNPIDWDLSPDGLYLAWIQSEAQAARIHLVSLRRDSGGASGQEESAVLLKGWSHQRAINWSADGKGWFITAQFPGSWTLLYVDVQGRARILQQGHDRYAPWVVPSPDGRHLAFSREGVMSNVWMLENF